MNFRDQPIVLSILPHTGLINGNDEGFRNVRVCREDSLDPDPLDWVGNYGVREHRIYALGDLPRLCGYWGKGLGVSEQMFLRAPAAMLLFKANQRLGDYKRELLMVDAWRSVRLQQQMFAGIFARIARERLTYSQYMTLFDWIKIGRAANDVGSYVALLRDDRFHEVRSELTNPNHPDYNYFLNLARYFKIALNKLIEEYMTYRGNLGQGGLSVDPDTPLAHASAGADDSYTIDQDTRDIACLGVPYDYSGEAGRLDFFESPDNLAVYEEAVARDAILRQYLAEFGILAVTRDVFNKIRGERRILYHARVEQGCTVFYLEPWHFNSPNTLGGKQSQLLAGAGNACHSLLGNVRDPRTGEITANWGNRAAQQMADELGIT